MSYNGMRKRTSLKDWIKESIDEGENGEKSGKIAAFALVHVNGNLEREIHTIKFNGKSHKIEDIASMFQHKAESYAQDLPGQQLFKVLAFYGGAAPESALPFSVGGATEYNGLATEAPDNRGMTQQGMRITESVVQRLFSERIVLFDQIQRYGDRMERIFDKMMQETVELKAENREMFSLLKEAAMDKVRSQHDLRMKEIQASKDAKDREMFFKFLPALANQILGREVFPESTADTALIETIAENLTQDDIMEIAKKLPPQLMGPLASRAAEIIQRRNAEKEAIAKSLPASGKMTPEQDAAGGK
jgi:hypothetical protein